MQQDFIDTLPQESKDEIKDVLTQHGMTDDEISAIEERNRRMALAQGGSFIRKHRREIERLNKLAQAAVLENNYDSYSYAIRKLRKLYRQPHTDELILAGWQTTRKQVWELINAQTSKVQ